MPDPDNKNNLKSEVAAIDLQVAALTARRKQCLALLVSENKISCEERREAMADVLAEAIVSLGERGLLVYKDDEPMQTPEKSPGECAPTKKKGRGSAK